MECNVYTAWVEDRRARSLGQDAPPQSELNPLTNPILERNLVRWAQVYFSSPPGKREQAVNKLLEEIKREVAGDRGVDAQEVVCSACQRKNSAGHKFCGGCGEALHPVTSDSSDSPRPAVQPETSVQWLRDRAFSSLEVSDAPKQRGWIYLVGALAIALAGFAYLQWAPGLQSKQGFQAKLGTSAKTGDVHASAPSAATEGTPQAEIQRPAETISAVPKASPNSKTPETQSAVAARTADERETVPAGLQPAVQRFPLLAGTPPHRVVDDGESGASDLRLAQRYLGGNTGVRDSSEAATLLWKAVRKQNTTAAVLLSDLYARGDGVPRNCDQARLLLLAAAKRGSPQAAEQLRQLESHGCQ